MTAAQLGLEFGAQKRDEGHAQVLAAFSADLVPHIAAVITRLANSGAAFTSDDVMARLDPAALAALAAHPNAVGALVQQAARRREIQKTGEYVPSVRPGARHRSIAKWRGAGV